MKADRNIREFLADHMGASLGVNMKALLGQNETKKTPDIPLDLELLLMAVGQAGYGPPELEYKFHEERKWMFDIAWPDDKVAFEREGGKFVTVKCKCGKPYTRFVSRHTDREGFEDDIEKYNAAAAAGWFLIRGTPRTINKGQALAAILATLKMRQQQREFQMALADRVYGQSELISRKAEKEVAK